MFQHGQVRNESKGVSVTLNTYTHLKIDDAKEEMEKLAKAQAATEQISKANGQEKKLKDKGWKMA